MDDEAPPPEEEASGGTPGWIVTFADMMSLLLCFFVLLLAMSTTDVEKFKAVADSMRQHSDVLRLEQIARACRGQHRIHWSDARRSYKKWRQGPGVHLVDQFEELD